MEQTLNYPPVQPTSAPLSEPKVSLAGKRNLIIIILLAFLFLTAIIVSAVFILQSPPSPKSPPPPLTAPILLSTPEPTLLPSPLPVVEESPLSPSDATADIEEELNQTLIEDFSSDFQDLSSDADQL